uniref:Uncharacterized protein n=1 Tax=Ochrobactrum phage ORM_20 TaxID=2985243 RepID=A0A9N6WZJ7_9VIRU|nr:hypothetical protein ORM20_00174 [Ochrobactrum phage ORM_20]
MNGETLYLLLNLVCSHGKHHLDCKFEPMIYESMELCKENLYRYYETSQGPARSNLPTAICIPTSGPVIDSRDPSIIEGQYYTRKCYGLCDPEPKRIYQPDWNKTEKSFYSGK